MKIQEIYDKYKIMPNLQEHMFRVAGVASIICNDFERPIDKESIIIALLLHDMGNMSKIKLDLFPQFAQPKGVNYWNKILNEFKQKYGNDDYKATYRILKELDVSQKTSQIVKSIEFAKATQNSKHNDFNKKISLYSDIRVAPFGVTSLKDRLAEVKQRYIKNKGVTEDFFNGLAKSMDKIEQQIFNYCKIKPEDITEEKVRPLFEELRNFEIDTKLI